MSRPRKENLEYFSFDVDFFRDKKINRLKAKFGSDGITVYQYVLCEIYHNGYYVEYDEDLVLDISDYFSFSEGKTMQILNYLFSRSLLVLIESKLPVPVKVISAPSVQRRYQEAKKSAKRDIAVDKRFWLLSKEETKSFIKLYPDDGFSEKNEDKSQKNDSYSEKNDTKESKGKERKGKESKVCYAFSIPCKNGSFDVTKTYLDELTHTYPEMDVEKVLSKIRDYLTVHPEKQGYISGIKSYIEMWLRDDNERGKYRRPKQQGAYDLSEYESWSVIDEMDETDEDKTSQK